MDDIEGLFDVFEETSTTDTVGLYLGVQETNNDVSIKRNAKYTEEKPSKKQKYSVIEEECGEENDEYQKAEKGRVISVETLEACVHEVAVPPDVEYVPLMKSTGKPAREYPFVLDPFQKEAILCIDNNQSVLISAHTSAGKTVAAEYSIAMALRENQRVIYTTPIKALSNQKYREFSDEFKDVGLITGDVTINYEASCLIMTTEILRNMLYRGSQIMREVKWVVFDEIHYMRDKERGVVWEETLILLPDNVRFVFLSATIPNARQFAEWVAFIHHQPCHVVYTEYRPVPLQHYLFPAGGAGIHLIVDEHGNFREDNFNLAMSILSDSNPVKEEFKDKRKQKMQVNSTNCFNIVKMLMERHMAPIIAFSFSKKECEIYAIQMAKLDFSTTEEKKLIEEILNNALDVLSEDDRKLPQVTSGEYIQMSGRAGRRGLDEQGIVLLMIDEKVSPEVAKCIVQGQADPLNSAFHLTYNMILNLMRVDDINPEYMLERSFAQFQNQATIPNVCNKLKDLQSEFNKIKIENEDKVALYYTLQSQISIVKERIREFIVNPMYLIPFLQVGRMVKIKDELREYDWGIILNFKKRDSKYRNPANANATSITVDVMIPSVKEEEKQGHIMEIITIKHTQILSLGAVKLCCPADLRVSDNQKSISKSLQETKKRFGEIPLLDPVKDMNIQTKSIKKAIENLFSLEQKLKNLPIHSNPNISTLCNLYDKKFKISEEIENTISEFKKLNRIDQLGELKRHKKVLRKLNYCSATDVVQTKGKIACELSSGEELLMTELIFNGIFTELNPAQCVALLSCFMCDEKSNIPIQMTEELSGPLRRMQELARTIVRVSNECHMEIDEDVYIDHFKPYLMDICHEWCNGSSFAEICRKTDIFEGSIIRSFRRLEEALRQLIQATRSIGNNELEKKFNDAITSLKRGIAFAASLYL
ncbi:hypothetical protein PGB90_008441 [Kerria lacca]